MKSRLDTSKPIASGNRAFLASLIKAIGGSRKRRNQDIWDTEDGEIMELRAHGSELGIFVRG